MSKHVIIYINNHQEQCRKLLEQMDQWEIAYETKNVSENREYMWELQEQGIFGTPVTFVDGTPILGMQKNKIKHALGLTGGQSTFFDI